MIILEDAVPVSRQIISAGSTGLRTDFSELVRRSILYSRQSRSIFEWAYIRLSRIEYLLGTVGGTVLYLAEAGSILNMMFSDLRSYVGDGLVESGYVVRGVYGTTYPELASTSDDVVALSESWFNKPRHGKTLDGRFSRRARLAQRYLSHAIPLHKDHPAKFRKFLRSFFLGDVVGPGPATGGSMYQYGQLATFTEMHAFKQFFSKRLVSKSSIGWAHWRLSSWHKWYGGQEICEQYAGSYTTGAPSSLDNRGLFHIDSIPAHPHPNCACYIEPAF